jgi:hypothetical protein
MNNNNNNKENRKDVLKGRIIGIPSLRRSALLLVLNIGRHMQGKEKQP